jgi:phosphate uptake regulator
MYISIGFTPKEVAVITKTADSIKGAMAMIPNCKESASLSLIHKDAISYETQPQDNGSMVLSIMVAEKLTTLVARYIRDYTNDVADMSITAMAVYRMVTRFAERVNDNIGDITSFLLKGE